jgi:carboxymethylenebutenolidase
MRHDLSIQTPDGEARAFAFTPSGGKAPWPAVLMFMDGVAIRPALFDMAERLASNGYYVLLPDMFWRAGPYDPIDVKKVFAQGDEERRKTFGALMGSTSPEKAMRDTGAFLDWLAQQPQARAGKVGVTGYCMGGSFSLLAAGTFPQRIAAAAAFHPSNLATDAPNSPHLLAPRIQASVLVAGGDEDQSFDEAQKERLAEALGDADVEATVSIWKGCRHGWVPADTPVHNPEGAERHWRELIALFERTLR